MEIRGIKYVGPIFDVSGYGQAARGYALSLHKLGIPLTIDSISFEEGLSDFGETSRILAPLVDKNIDYNIVFIHLTANLFPTKAEVGKTNIGYFVWETDKVPREWVDDTNQSLHSVITASEWGADIFRKSGISIPVHVVPHGIDVDEFIDADLYTVAGIKPNAYKFYGIFQFTERKHPMALIKSYWSAFQNNENVALILKTYRNGFSDSEKEAVRSTIQRLKKVTKMRSYPPIYLIADRLDRSEVLGIHKTGDCLVHLDRGEGFGLCVAKDTNITTPTGAKLASEISKGDKVMSADGKFHTVSSVSRRFVKNGLRISSLLHEDIIVSEDHPLYVTKDLTLWKRRNWSSEKMENSLRWVKAKYVFVGDYIAVPKPCLDKELNEYIYIDDFVSTRSKIGGVVNDKVRLNDDLLNLFGFYLASGKVNSKGFVEFNYSTSESYMINKLIKIFESLFGVSTDYLLVSKWRENNKLLVQNKKISMLFSNLFGNKEYNKHIPTWLFNCGMHLKALLNGIFYNIGEYDGTYKFVTTSRDLTYQIKSIFNSVGCCPGIKHKKFVRGNKLDRYTIIIYGKDYEYFTGKTVNVRSNWFWSSDRFLLVKVQNVKKVEYNDIMYDFSIETSRNFVGNGLLLHNCPFEAGACGNPILITGWGGALEYAKRDNSYLANYTLTPVFGMPWSPWYYGDQLWAEPDCGHAIKLLRTIYNNQDEARARGKKLQQYIIDNFSWDIVGKKLIKTINSL